MAFTFNKIPVSSEDELKLIEKAREELAPLKEKAFGPESNEYDFCESGKLYSIKSQIRIVDLEKEIRRILSDDFIDAIGRYQIELRTREDYNLTKTVMEEILPIVMPPETLVEYKLFVVGRKLKKIDSKKDNTRGREDEHYSIKILPAKEWTTKWERYIFLDERADSEEIVPFLPGETDSLVSDVQKLYAVKETCESRNRNNNHTKGFLPGHTVDDSKSEIDFRTKSGVELMWKYIPYLTKLEIKSGEKRESIVDLAGVRVIYLKDFEKNAIKLHQYFMNKYVGSCKGSLILQALDMAKDKRGKVEQEVKFLENLPTEQLRGIYRRILKVEDRSDLLERDDVESLDKKYYLEMLIPFCATSNGDSGVFGKNVINILAYHLPTHKKINEKHDHFAYDDRRGAWRDEHYSPFEWLVVKRIAPALLDKSSLKYMEKVYQPRIHKIFRSCN